MPRKFRIGIIGFGRMGHGFVAAMLANPAWEVAAICDLNPAACAEARQLVPKARICSDPEDILKDKSIETVGLFTLADARPALIRRRPRRKNTSSPRNPSLPDIQTEWDLLAEIEQAEKKEGSSPSTSSTATPWYYKQIQQRIAAGEIGDPRHHPRLPHDPRPHAHRRPRTRKARPFHDCGMHYVDVARWYARSEFKTWHAQGIRMWNHNDPWWVQCHGTFDNGIVFDITQGFVYGHLAKDKTPTTATSTASAPPASPACATISSTPPSTSTPDNAPSPKPLPSPGTKILDIMVDIFACAPWHGKTSDSPPPAIPSSPPGDIS